METLPNQPANLNKPPKSELETKVLGIVNETLGANTRTFYKCETEAMHKDEVVVTITRHKDTSSEVFNSDVAEILNDLQAVLQSDATATYVLSKDIVEPDRQTILIKKM